jgi:outer membrane protein assembly factor BamB
MRRRGWILGALAAALAAGDWPDFGRTPGSTRESSEPIGASFGGGWSWNLGGPIVATPVAADGVVVAATEGGTLTGLRESDGAVLWSVAPGGDIVGTPAVYNGRVYVPMRDGAMAALRITDGAAVWTASTGGSVASSPKIDSARLLVGSGVPTPAVRALDPATGATLWQTPLDDSVYSSPALDGGTVWIATARGDYQRVDAATGAPLGAPLSTGGLALLSSPASAFGQVFAIPGGADMNFYALGAWSVTLSDPSPPAGATAKRTRLAGSSPMVVGPYVAAVIRFEYFLDADSDGTDDTFVMQEYAVAIDPAARTQVWQTPLGSQTSGSRNLFPTLGLSPTPVSVDGGVRLVVGSAVTPSLRLLDAAGGGVIFSMPTDAPGRSSPITANGRVLWGTDGGTLYSLQGSANRAPEPPVSGFAPSGPPSGSAPVGSLSWDPASDAEDSSSALRTVVRIDADGEILEDWLREIVTAPGETTAVLDPTVSAPGVYTWAARTMDSAGALSAWSASQSFTLTVGPEPPASLTATPSIGAVFLEWEPSVTPQTAGYHVRWAPAGQSLGAPVWVAATSTMVSGLTNGVTYDFDVRGVDTEGDEGFPATAQAAPTDEGIAAVNGIPYATLAEAVTAAAPGSTIQLGRGTFVVPAGMTLEGSSLIGVSPHETWLDATGLATALTLIDDAASTPMTLTQFSLFGADVGIDAKSGTASITHVVVRDMSGDAILVSGPAELEILQVTLVNNGDAAVEARDGSVMLRNSILLRNGTGIRCTGSAVVTHRYNDVWGSGRSLVDYDGCEPGVGEFGADIVFVDEAAGDFRVWLNQASVDAGDPADPYDQEPAPNGSRVDLGAYGNTAWANAESLLGLLGVSEPAGGGSGSCSGRGLVGGGGPWPAAALGLMAALILWAKAARRPR